ncbi:hypothetical protein PIB30_054709 [Stylosanthes scabra]|uniref:Uncharacterized protein n=1 Tax=Stylosanthes scabra TaxID=79078 RepID=A0ABU6XHE8_9FABA|nr:hypothetical protein [Stylosanthes scabra]
MKSFRLLTSRLLCLHMHDCCVRQRRNTSPPLSHLPLFLLLLCIFCSINKHLHLSRLIIFLLSRLLSSLLKLFFIIYLPIPSQGFFYPPISSLILFAFLHDHIVV